MEIILQITTEPETLGLIQPNIETLWQKAAVKACAEEDLYSNEIEISLLITDNTHIRELNRDYRGKDEPTDVLSFAFLEDENHLAMAGNKALLLGEIIISIEKAAEQAASIGQTIEQELVFLFVHGLLHLLGYDHIEPEEEMAMRKRQREIMQFIIHNA
jgi:probable rRNA maturation factor